MPTIIVIRLMAFQTIQSHLSVSCSAIEPSFVEQAQHFFQQVLRLRPRIPLTGH